jgi:hypothetical protein
MEWKREMRIDVPPIKHICLVGTNRAPVQMPLLILRSGASRVSKDEGHQPGHMVRDARSALLTMRV